MEIQHPAIDLKMKLLVEIIIDFKLLNIFVKRSILDVSRVLSSPLITINQMFFTNNKKAISGFFVMETLLPSQDFNCLK